MIIWPDNYLRKRLQIQRLFRVSERNYVGVTPNGFCKHNAYTFFSYSPTGLVKYFEYVRTESQQR